MAGTDSRFDAAGFREAIKFAMRMGAPTALSEQVKFRWVPVRTYTTDDAAGFPLSWTDSPLTNVAPADLAADVAIEFATASSLSVSSGTSIGHFDTTRGVVTILDVDWTVVLAHGGRTPDQVTIDGNVYVVRFVGPPLGLFDVTIYQLNIEALDES